MVIAGKYWSAFIPPRAQASRRCENTSDAKRQAAKLR
jgi:hypothetical protein